MRNECPTSRQMLAHACVMPTAVSWDMARSKPLFQEAREPIWRCDSWEQEGNISMTVYFDVVPLSLNGTVPPIFHWDTFMERLRSFALLFSYCFTEMQ